MIEINGEQHIQPQDWSVVGYDGGKYATITDGNTFQRVLLSDIVAQSAPLSHDHEGDYLYPTAIYMKPGGNVLTLIADGTAYIQIHPQAYGATIKVTAWNIYDNSVFNHFLGNPTGTSSVVKIQGTVGYRTALADGWLLYPSFLRLKTDIEQIRDPHDKLRPIRGLTYKQEGVSMTGIAVDDLEKSSLPGLIARDKDGEVEGINPVALIAPLLEAVRDLEERVLVLEQKGVTR